MTEPRYDWTIDEVLAVIERPFHDLLAAAHACHRERFDPHEIQGAKLLSIKTGACPKDCAYCPQSARNETDLQPEPLMDLPDILAKAEQAKAEGATRFCMGAAWRSPNDRQVDEVAEAVHAVADLFMESCVTLGMLTDHQAKTLADAGLDYYNHNLDTPPTSTARSSRRVHLRTASTRSRPAERSVSASARAGSWAWARRDGSGRACCSNWPS
ncbi:MAG: radical SAM protein [Acidimicrobiaceae bacterium]